MPRLKQIPVETGKVPKPTVTRKKARRSPKTQAGPRDISY